jgi:hypothetical protein
MYARDRHAVARWSRRRARGAGKTPPGEGSAVVAGPLARPVGDPRPLTRGYVSRPLSARSCDERTWEPARWQDARVDITRSSMGEILTRAGAIFVVTWLVFYFIAWNEQSPIYTDSDQRLLLLSIAWIGVGVALLVTRRRAWGIAWLLGSIGFLGGYMALALVIVFSMGS